MLRGTDRAAFAVALTTRLRARGVVAGVTGVETFVRALEAVPPDSRSSLYWTARISLVRRQPEIEAFDAVFAAVFDDAVLELDPHARRGAPGPPSAADDRFAPVAGTTAQDQTGAGLPWTTLPPAVAGADDSGTDLAVPLRRPSDLAGLADVPFEQLDPGDMEILADRLSSALRSWPARRTRRFRAHRGGHRVAVRPTIARSRRTGWEPIELVRVRAVERPRRVVMLCDVSQSMQAQAAAYFHLMRALAVTADAEVFAFATTLTRLTPVLAHRSAQVAIEQATDRVVDRFGGTRIATNVQTLLSSHHGGVLRGAVVIIGSDGWDNDAPAALGAAMARLRRRAFRVIWINPRVGAPGFEPRVATMAAALPYCHELLPAENFRSLERVITEISRSVSSTGSRGSRAGTARP